LLLDLLLVVESQLTHGYSVAHANGPLDLVGEERLMIDLIVLESAGSSF
jgi:hypothetical protein